MKSLQILASVAGCAAAIALSVVLTGCKSSGEERSTGAYAHNQVPYPEDGQDASIDHFSELQGVRYMEFVLVGSEPVDGRLKGSCYNTTGENMAPEGRDSAPQSMVDALNASELAKENDASVWLNPQRYWLLDWADMNVGTVRDFGGLNARWCGIMSLPNGAWTPMTPTMFMSRSKFGFNKGTTIYLLDDPNGNTWIMESLSTSVDPMNTYANRGSLGSRLSLPSGWNFRKEVLDQDLILTSKMGVARILKDNLDNIYDLTGPGYSSFKP
jgi:hypothetical protein